MYITTIEGVEFSLFFDYDQLRDNKISELSDNGKIEWLRRRMEMLFLRPITLSFKEDSNIFKLTAISEEGPANLVIAMFSILMNGIEALGSFITPVGTSKGDNFRKYMSRYLPMWDVEVNGTRYSNNRLIEILWTHYRNGIAHGFIIEGGGIDFEADKLASGYFVTNQGHLEIGPRKFIKDFSDSISTYFEDIKKDNGGIKRFFMDRFNRIYPN